MVHSPERRLRTAWWRATRLEEQAVSMVMDGPLKSKKYEMRFDKMERALPVA